MVETVQPQNCILYHSVLSTSHINDHFTVLAESHNYASQDAENAINMLNYPTQKIDQAHI